MTLTPVQKMAYLKAAGVCMTYKQAERLLANGFDVHEEENGEVWMSRMGSRVLLLRNP